MNEAGFALRPAGLQDASAIANVHVASWAAAYRGIVDSSILDHPDATAARTRMWERVLRPSQSQSPLRVDTIVALQHDRVVGFASWSADITNPTIGEVQTLYVHPNHWGRGAGAQLLAAALDNLSTRFARSGLWVFADNSHARTFYERHNWMVDTTTPVEHWSGPAWPGGPRLTIAVPEIRYVREHRNITGHSR